MRVVNLANQGYTHVVQVDLSKYFDTLNHDLLLGLLPERVRDLVAISRWLKGSGTFITNPGSVYSEPVITVNGSGDITLIIGMTGSITLDSTLQEAYSGFASLNSQMSGEFPRLLPGQNAISWMGNVTSLGIAPNWRKL